jgi:stalled ribosome rescue protein Dom34
MTTPITTHHVAVWIDHKEARIFQIDPETFTVSKVKAPQHFPRRPDERGNRADDGPFYHQVAEAIRDAEGVLVVGPSSAKLEFIRHLHRHDHSIAPKIVGVETLDHPTDAQFATYVRHYFHEKEPRLGTSS